MEPSIHQIPKVMFSGNGGGWFRKKRWHKEWLSGIFFLPTLEENPRKKIRGKPKRKIYIKKSQNKGTVNNVYVCRLYLQYVLWIYTFIQQPIILPHKTSNIGQPS